MTSEVLYRKWRPQTFAEVAGQEPITHTLINAIASGKVAHAYLFTGPRGTGKTTTGRLLAKAVNCTDPREGEPCNACDSCRPFLEGRALDLIELDAASNRGIDEIRALRDKVGFAPAAARYKLYLVDEVHMLTEPAFNALLKTLEEPPHHVVFVLATTESHKVPLTILSRCQRFEFRRIPSAEMARRLQEMVQGEGIQIDQASIEMIAQAAEGSLRDAQSLLDQIVSYSGSQVRAEDVQTVLGLVDRHQVEEALGYILAGAGGPLMQLVDGLYTAGHDLRLFGMGLLESIRDPDLCLIMKGRGIIGAVAALPFYTRYEEALELCSGKS